MKAVHRARIDAVMELLRSEMAELNALECPGSNILSYVDRTEELFAQQSASLAQTRERLQHLKKLVMEEEAMSRHACISR